MQNVKEVWPFSSTYMRKLLERFSQEAEWRTKCKRESSACCVFDYDRRRFQFVMFNGPEQNECCKETENCGCKHAEIRAIEEAFKEDEPIDMIFTVHKIPCQECAEAIISAGFIKALVFEDLTEISLFYFLQERINVYQLT